MSRRVGLFNISPAVIESLSSGGTRPVSSSTPMMKVVSPAAPNSVAQTQTEALQQSFQSNTNAPVATTTPTNQAIVSNANGNAGLLIGLGVLAAGAGVYFVTRKKKKKMSGIPVVPILVVGGLGVAGYLYLKKTGIISGMSIGQSADTFSVDQIVGKTLIAKTTISIYDYPADGSNVIATVKTGNPVGAVYSYLGVSPSENRSTLWWIFQDESGNFYYTPHHVGYFDISSLVQQGVLTDQQIAEQGTVQGYLDKYLPWVLGGVVIIALGTTVIKKAL